MSKKPRLKVVQESKTGLNQKFLDTKTGQILNRGDVVKNGDLIISPVAIYFE